MILDETFWDGFMKALTDIFKVVSINWFQVGEICAVSVVALVIAGLIIFLMWLMVGKVGSP